MSDLRGTITNVAKNVTKTSGDILKTTKLNMSLSTAESNIKTIYNEIGRKVHEIYKYGGSIGDYFDGKYAEILACEQKISEIREQIGIIKGVRNCPKCDKTVDRTSGFCSNCGAKMDLYSSEVVNTAEHDTETPVAVQPMPTDWSGGHAEIPPPEPPPVMHSPPPVPPAPVPAMPTKVCRVCRAENEISTKFCLSCGRIVD